MGRYRDALLGWTFCIGKRTVVASLFFEVPIGLRSYIPQFLVTFVAIIIVGVAWEVFEYVTGMYNVANYTLDTTLDLATDVGGMLFAYLLFKKYVR